MSAALSRTIGSALSNPVRSLRRAYEFTQVMHNPANISFEHAWFLLLALARRDEVGIGRCGNCGGLRVQDLLARRSPVCARRQAVLDAAAKGPF